MVDLSKAKAGDTVKFRCGGEAVLSYAEPYDDDKDLYTLFFGKNHDGFNYQPNGMFYSDMGNGVFDITEVIHAPVAFDWKDAKWGQAFRLPGDANEIYYFIGRAIDGDLRVRVLCQSKTGGHPAFLNKCYLTRAPEHDVEGG